MIDNMTKKLSSAQVNSAIAKGHAVNAATTTVLSLDALSKLRAEWEKTDFKKANEGLYDLLAKCLAVYEAKFLAGSKLEQKALRDELTRSMKSARVKVQKNTNTLTMLTRHVFASDRKRAHGYAYVLTAAVGHKVTAANLPEYIKTAGGIEEIKRLMVKKPEAIERAAKIQLAKTVVQAELEQAEISPLASLNLPGLSGKYALCLVMPATDGTANVVGVLSELSDGMIKSLIKAMAVGRAKDDKEAAQMNNEVQDMLSGMSANDAVAQIAA
jgi:hypothetical protein